MNIQNITIGQLDNPNGYYLTDKPVDGANAKLKKEFLSMFLHKMNNECPNNDSYLILDTMSKGKGRQARIDVQGPYTNPKTKKVEGVRIAAQFGQNVNGQVIFPIGHSIHKELAMDAMEYSFLHKKVVMIST